MDARPDRPLPSRVIPGFDACMGRHTAIILTGHTPPQGARISALTPRPDLDAAISPPLGWHWYQDGGELVCRLGPTDADVLAQVADDLGRDDTSDYQFVPGGPSADDLREIATRRMALTAAHVQHQCLRLLRLYRDHLRDRAGEDD